MRASNTKLTKFQKAELKADMARFISEGGKLYSYPDMGVTLAVMPISGRKTAWVSSALASELELKFRGKVGKSVALARFYAGQYIVVKTPATGDWYNAAYGLTEAISGY